MRQLLAFLFIACTLANCSKNLVPLTDSLIKEKGWDKNEVQRIQFYTSDVIVIQREFRNNATAIVSGKVKTVDGRQVEEIKIKKGTPGVAIHIPSENKMEISFDRNDDAALSFGPNPNRGARFYLLADEWKNKIGKVHYEGKEWYASAQSADVFLMVDLQRIKDWEVSQRKAKGRKVGN